MNRVAASEHELLSIAQAVVGQSSFEDVEPLLERSRRAPPQLGPTAISVLEETLSKGVVLGLMRAGGWRHAQSLQVGASGVEVRTGRLWERHPPLKLAFTGASLEVLRWLLAAPLGAPRCEPLELKGSPTPADELVLYGACALLAGTGCEPSLVGQEPLRRSTLCRLGFADLFGRGGGLAELPELSLEGLSVLLEGLQGDLARRWVRAERSKAEIFHPAQLRQLGEAQQTVLGSFLRAADRAGRRDLCTFLVDAGEALLVRSAGAGLIPRLDRKAPLRERQEALRASGAFLRALGQLRRWDQEHRSVRFIDDGYAGAQLLVREWDRLGERGFAAAETMLNELESLAPTGP